MTGPLIAITGAGAVASLGRTRRELFEALVAGCCGCGPASDIESGPVPLTGAAQAVALPESFAPELVRESRYLRWAAIEALREAQLLDSGGRLRASAPAPAQRAATVGTTLHGIRAGGRWLRGGTLNELRHVQAPVILGEALAGLEFEGPRFTTCAACASGLTGVSLARALLQAGEADVAIAGGYDPISEYSSSGFASLRLVAAGLQRPFCRDREGLKVAEGYGLLVLERLDDALQRSAPILAVIAGIGETSDGHHLTQPHPEGMGPARAIRLALGELHLAPEAIGMIAAHGTGTPANDLAEAAALRKAFGPTLQQVPVSCAKSHLGHTLGGAGAVELALSIEAMAMGIVPPLANVSAEEIEFAELDVVTGSARRGPIAATLNVSIGFGGSNAALALVREAPEREPSPGRGAPAQEAVAITGIGVLLPQIAGAQQFLAALGAPPSRAEHDLGAPAIDLYQALLDPRKSRRLSDYAKLTVAAARMALQDAAIEDTAAFCEACEAVLGTTHGSPSYAEAYYREIVESGPEAANPMLFAEGVPNAGAAQLSIALGARGACQSILGSRTAGLEALHVARLRIASGRTDRSIVCASEEYSPLVAEAYRAWQLAAGSGGADFFIGGGAVALVLESASRVEARSARVLGWVESSALRCCSALTLSAAVRRSAEALGAARPSMATPRVTHARTGSWASAVERRAARAVDCPIEPGLPWTNAEFFSVGPLAALAAGVVKSRAHCTLAVDFHGPIAAAATRPANATSGGRSSDGLRSPD